MKHNSLMRSTQSLFSLHQVKLYSVYNQGGYVNQNRYKQRPYQNSTDQKQQQGHKELILGLVDSLAKTYKTRDVEQRKQQQKELQEKIIAAMSDRTKLEPSTQIWVINKMSKEEEYQRQGGNSLKPIWNYIGSQYQEYQNLIKLNTEQIGILVWSFGHVDVDVIKKNMKLWNSLEMLISTKVGLKRFNNFNLCQVCTGFQKVGRGSREFWGELEYQFIDRQTSIDRVGLSIMINSFGRSSQASLSKILKAFSPIIINQINKFTMKESLMIMSGIANEYTTKKASQMNFDDVFKIYEQFQLKILRSSELKEINYSQMATLVWSFSIIKNSKTSFQTFWNALFSQLDDFITQNPNIMREGNFYHTLTIAKGMTYIDPHMEMSFQFWKQFKSLFLDKEVLKNLISNLKWHEFGSILYTLSQIKILDQNHEWNIIVDLFKQKLIKEYDQEKVIKGITSLSLAQVGDQDDFWFDVFDAIDQNINVSQLDPFLKQNLLWSIARNISFISTGTLESIISKVVGPLTQDLESYIKEGKENTLTSSIPNLVWGLRVLSIQDEALFEKIDKILSTIADNLEIDQILSIIPCFFEMGHLGNDILLKKLENRFDFLKMGKVNNENEGSKVNIIHSYFDKIHQQKSKTHSTVVEPKVENPPSE